MTTSITIKASENKVSFRIPASHYQDVDMYADLTFDQAKDFAKVLVDTMTAYEDAKELVEEVSKTVRWSRG